MGTWGPHSFENDDAADFLAGLEAAKVDPPVVNAEAIGEALDVVFAVPAADLDAEDAAKGVAAAEVIAAALGHPREGGDKDPFELKASCLFYDDYVAKAVAVLSRVREPVCELAELWDETDDVETWRASLAELAGRLRAAASAHGLSIDFKPVDEGGPTEQQVIRDEVEQVYADMMVEMERVADAAGDDPQVEVLRHMVRKLHLIHRDITNMRYFVCDSLDDLTARLDGLEAAKR